MLLTQFQPKFLWKYFEEISRIPRCSKNKSKIISYILDKADSLGLETRHDSMGNIVVMKPFSLGYENVPTTIIQCHLDMVCEKYQDISFDFSTDTINIILGGDYITANGTTLGADNGIGVAACLAIMNDKSLQHGQLQLLFTVDEESGLVGASNLGDGLITGRYMLNIDSEEEGIFYIGCAGGITTTGTFKISLQNIPVNYLPYKLTVNGLIGGHSGLDIHKSKGNAIKILNIVITHLKQFKCFISSIKGGNSINAIPREAEAIVYLSENNIIEIQKIIYQSLNTIKSELTEGEPNLQITLNKTNDPMIERKAINTHEWENISKLITELVHGVVNFDPNDSSLVETSSNLATITLNGNQIIIETSQRSTDSTKLDNLVNAITNAFKFVGASIYHSNKYPTWKPNFSSNLLSIAKSAYKSLYKQDALVKTIHAGLECSIIKQKYPEIDVISFGPTIEAVHTPDEKVYIPSVDRFWTLLVSILKKIH